ncbi:MAG: Kae1-associated kinase Bud32 [Thermofilaceae archaeon]|nr:Kae1-associated kinase Bud32 [Thermofilaceae archaeon]MCX8180490.1 Kae1-associated kinase Bud32 [Thermofilaceae archaeon]MDW8003313.1 Kae1-associated kinase Bud32 [Thermofilaceae archaeon]
MNSEQLSPVDSSVKILHELGSESRELLGIGAEAVVLRCIWRGFDAVAKIRLPKSYRDSRLDMLIRAKRTGLETRLLTEAKKLGVPSPTPLYVDTEICMLVMDYIPGPKLRDVIQMSKEVESMFEDLGRYAGFLHERGIVHGDLTTSNVIVSKRGLYVIDFGLGAFSNDLEEQGVDVHLMLRSLESTNPSMAQRLYLAFLEGYEEARGVEARKLVEDKVVEIRKRGRYVAERRKVLRA